MTKLETKHTLEAQVLAQKMKQETSDAS